MLFKASERLIPFHEQLTNLGLIDFFNKHWKTKVVWLFLDLTHNINDGHSRKAGRWFNEQYLRKTLEITDPSKSFHSFRHTVADRLKHLGVAESFIAELLGHSSGDTMSFGRYGKRYQPKVLMEETVSKTKKRIQEPKTFSISEESGRGSGAARRAKNQIKRKIIDIVSKDVFSYSAATGMQHNLVFRLMTPNFSSCLA